MRPKAVILDFDGVVLESVNAKGDAFADLFAEHAESVAEIVALHHRLSGVSRFDKFDLIYSDILKTPLSQKEKDQLGTAYALCVKERVLNCSFVPGAREFLEAIAAKVPIYVASATPQSELEEIVIKKGIGSYFAAVFGSPTPKADVVKHVMKEHQISGQDILMIGDSIADLEGAKKGGAHFMGRVALGETNPFPKGTKIVQDLQNLLSEWPDITEQLPERSETVAPKISIIVQARMSSQRLPGKMLMQVSNKPMLQYLLERLKGPEFFDEIVVIVATSTEAEDDAIEQFCEKFGVPCERGALNDVARRFIGVAQKYDLDAVVRISGDSPLIAPELIRQGIQLYVENSCDLVTNVYPRSFPKGQSVEVISVRALRQAYGEMTSQDREHVTPYLYRHADQYQIHNFSSNVDLSALQLSVDTEDDLNFFSAIVKASDQGVPPISLDSILSLGTDKGMYC